MYIYWDTVKLNATNGSSRSRPRRDAIINQLKVGIHPESNKLNHYPAKGREKSNQKE